MKRPTAEELLSSELVPPAQLEANELQEMLRHALANPQSKAYKHLVARCLDQQSDTIEELTYHLGLVPISPTLELIKVRHQHLLLSISIYLKAKHFPTVKNNFFVPETRCR